MVINHRPLRIRLFLFMSPDIVKVADDCESRTTEWLETLKPRSLPQRALTCPYLSRLMFLITLLHACRCARNALVSLAILPFQGPTGRSCWVSQMRENAFAPNLHSRAS